MPAVETGFTIINDGTEVYSIGFIRGVVSIADFQVSISVSRSSKTDPWLLDVMTVTKLHLPGLAELAGWMMKDEVVSYIPDTFMPFGQGFDIPKLNIQYNLSDSQLELLDFAIENSAPWIAIAGYVTFDDTSVDASITKFSQPDQGLTATITSSIYLGSSGGGITFSAIKATTNGDWVFTGTLINTIEFSLKDLLDKLSLSSTFAIPNEDWLPTLTLEELNANMTPQEAIYHVDGKVTTAWTIPFVDIDFPMKSLGGTVDIKHEAKETDTPEDKNKANWFKAIIYGEFEFSTITATLALQLGSEGVDNIFTAELTPTEVEAVQLTTLADSLSDGEATSKWTAITPTDISAISFGSAYLYYNQTQGDFFIYGGITNFGDAIFYSKNIGTAEAPKKGYIFSFAVASGFKFSNLVPALSIIDDVLEVTKAGFSITTYEVASATELVTEINGIINAAQHPGTITSPIQQGNLPVGTVVAGTHIYAGLKFKSDLFKTIVEMRQDPIEPDVTLYATFPTGTDSDPTSTTFNAVFSAFKLFNFIEFKGKDGASVALDDAPGIMMSYTAATEVEGIKTEEYHLEGAIVFTVFGTEYSFIGELTSNKIQTNFTIETPDDKPLLPWGLPDAMTLAPSTGVNKLGLNVVYTFATEEEEKSIELKVFGKGKIADIGFTGTLFIRNATVDNVESTLPLLVEVTLDDDLSISDAYNKLVTGGGNWPADLFDIKFLKNDLTTTPPQKGRVYYYDQAADTKEYYKDKGYKDQFNIESTIELTFLTTFRFNLDVQVLVGDGIIGSIGLINPIDIYILQLASKSHEADDATKPFIGGPLVSIDTTGGSTKFVFETGVNFMQMPFFGADISIGKDAQNDTKITTELTSALPIEHFPVFTIAFSYSKNDGFKVENFPGIKTAEKILDFVSEINNIFNSVPSGGGCGELVDFVAKNVLDQDYDISLGFAEKVPSGQTDKRLYITITGSYILSFGGEEIANIVFPSLDFMIPNDFSLDKLFDQVITSIKGAASDSVQKLLDDPTAIAKYLGIVFLEEAGKFAAKLLCEALVDAVVEAAAEAAGEAAAAASTAATVAGDVIAGVTSVISCFVAGTKVTMSDGSIRNIEDVQIGDKLLGMDGVMNTVEAFDRPVLGSRKLYSINEGPYFVTAEHPLLTTEGWKSFDPKATALENPDLTVQSLQIGDVLVLENELEEIRTINTKEDESNTQLYNFKLTGNNTYYADSYTAHNKGGSCFIAGTAVYLMDGNTKNIEDIQIGETLLGVNNMPNEVLKYDHPLLGERKLYSINNGPFFITAEHPLLTKDGWKSIDPAATADENPNLEVGKLQVGEILILKDGAEEEIKSINGTTASPDTQLYNFKLSGNNTYFADNYSAHNKGSSCFIAGTKVRLADGTIQNIEDIGIGDVLVGMDNFSNTVTAFDHPLLGERKLYAINESSNFVTAEHPFMTTKGWKSIDPIATANENPNLQVEALTEGDVLVLWEGKTTPVQSIEASDADPTTQLYNFILSGNSTYFANDYLIHNKDSCFVAGTEVVLIDGEKEHIENIKIGDVLLGINDLPNEVLEYDHPLLGNRLLYAINDGPFFITAEHPLLTKEGWKSIDPAATANENPNLKVEPLQVGDILIKLSGEEEEILEIRSEAADAGTQLYNFKLAGNNTYFADNYAAHNKGSCFVAGTIVLLEDGSACAIESVKIGDVLLGTDGEKNTVTAFDHPLLSSRKLYSINAGPYFVTAEHPILTTKGWKSINPAATADENPRLNVAI
ncbi:MAG: hypothetical protein JKY54_04360, partial [Flavobacteriales bacterium]|nr:hypothetical protein [Flavobacteriales bacterium]